MPSAPIRRPSPGQSRRSLRSVVLVVILSPHAGRAAAADDPTAKFATATATDAAPSALHRESARTTVMPTSLAKPFGSHGDSIDGRAGNQRALARLPSDPVATRDQTPAFDVRPQTTVPLGGVDQRTAPFAAPMSSD